MNEHIEAEFDWDPAGPIPTHRADGVAAVSGGLLLEMVAAACGPELHLAGVWLRPLHRTPAPGVLRLAADHGSGHVSVAFEDVRGELLPLLRATLVERDAAHARPVVPVDDAPPLPAGELYDWLAGRGVEVATRAQVASGLRPRPGGAVAGLQTVAPGDDGWIHSVPALDACLHLAQLSLGLGPEAELEVDGVSLVQPVAQPARVTLTRDAAGLQLELSTAGGSRSAGLWGVRASRGRAVGAVGEPPSLAQLRQLADDVLGRPVPTEVDLLDAGVDSLGLLRLVAACERRFALEVPLPRLLESPTLRHLHGLLELGLPSPVPDAVQAADAVQDAEPRPVSPIQEAMWLVSQSAALRSSYNEYACWRLDGPVDVPALRRALLAFVSRHAMLTSRFGLVGGRVCAWRAEGIDFEVLERAGAPDWRVLSELGALVAEPFDLATRPPLRVRIASLGSDTTYLLIAAHHIACDAWSLQRVAVPEIAHHYACELGRVPDVQLPPAHATPAPMEPDEDALAWWQEHLDGMPQRLELPTDHPRGVVTERRGASAPVALSDAASDALAHLSERCGATRFAVLLAGLAVVVQAHTGSRDFALGTLLANRVSALTEWVVGCFANPLPIRMRVPEGTSFAELVRATSASVKQVIGRQGVPFERIVRRVVTQRHAGANPLFQVGVNLLPESEALTLPGVDSATVALDPGTHKIDLMLHLQPGRVLQGHVEYDAALFEQATVLRIVRQLSRLLESAAADPGADVADLVLSDPAELSDLMRGWNGLETSRELVPLSTLIDASCRVHADRTAVSFDGERLSYRELDARASAIATLLDAGGIGEGDRVAVLLDAGLDLPAAIFAVQKLGAAFVPLDPAGPHERTAMMLQDAAPRALLSSRELLAARPDHPGVASFAMEDVGAARPLPTRAPRQDDLAYIMFTSGSTGRPKGVRIHHGALSSFIVSIQARMSASPDDRVLCATRVTFDPWLMDVFWPLSIGASVRLLSGSDARDPRFLADWIASERPSFLYLTPTRWRLLIEGGWPGEPGLQALCGGEPLTPALHEALSPRVARIWNLYGPTETTVWTTAAVVAAPDRISLGRPIDGAQIYLTDGSGRLVPVGAVGEVCIAGAGVTHGFCRPEDGEGRLEELALPDGRSVRVYRTGDLARYTGSGRLGFLGRADRQVKIRGTRVECGEVEVALERHGDVERAVVAARSVEGRDMLVAYFTASHAVDVAELRAHARRHLPDPMVPRIFTRIDHVPLNVNGKVDMAALPAPAAASAGARERPSSATERAVGKVLARLLGRPEVGRDDDFFDLGGDSLMAIEAVSLLSSELGAELTIEDVIDGGSVEGIAERIDAARAGSPRETPVPMAPFVRDSILPPSIEASYTEGGARATLLTGATGFLGGHLLDELRRRSSEPIYCLVREESVARGEAKLTAALQGLGLPAAGIGAQVRVLCGDVDEPRCGLSPGDLAIIGKEVRHVFHCAAMVNFGRPYRSLRQTNTAGTLELLRLCGVGARKTFHHISTVAVAQAAESSGPVPADAPLDRWQGLRWGYSQSKWAAERLVAAASERDYDVRIYRPGLVVAHSELGIGPLDDAFSLAVLASAEVGVVPSDPDAVLWHLSPVDDVARRIVRLSGQEAPSGAVWHVAHPEPVRVSDVGRWIQQAVGDAEMETVPTPEWRSRLRASGATPRMDALLGLLERSDSLAEWTSRVEVADAERAVDEPWSSVDAAFLQRMLQSFVRRGLLSAGRGGTPAGGRRPS